MFSPAPSPALCDHAPAPGGGSAHIQRPVYSFSSEQLQKWNRFFGVSAPQPMGAPPPPSSGSVVHVLVSGNFGATFTVHGAGSGTASRGDNYIDITTNRPLTFTASGFVTLQTGGSSASTAGSIVYEMQLYAGTSSSVGSAIGSAQSGIDAAFNGATLQLLANQIPGDNHVVLRLSRTLTLSQLAKGANDYTASGTISVTIN